ncbi:TIGR02679 family protein [Bacillus sp. AFS073361]|uniref:TIGR02679 family protein n=1 Tax=Bacillaceae TaxID=186817 RepID=UPI000BF3E814|nr:TIGR02679 family protein [Bacillus sp. AFS073361]PFP22920.1 TIGR02679 family protein [Bacillus sp. AFS073361]
MSDKVQIFKEEPGFMKLFTLFREKYRSLGRIAGTVNIQFFSYEEVESIAGFLGQSVDSLLEKGRVSLLSFDKELAQTGFKDYSLIQLLEEVFQESIMTKSEQSSLEEAKEMQFFQNLRSSHPEGTWWWDWIESKQPDSRWIWSLYRQNSEELKDKLTAVYNAFEVIPSKKSRYERLPLFAQRTTGNPHYFDIDQFAGKLLLYCLYIDKQHKGIRVAGMPKTTEEINDLFSNYGLMRDDLWSFVTCRGFFAAGEKGLNPVWNAAVETDSVLNVPLKELLKSNKIWPVKGNKVWIVENSSVCSTIIDEVPEAPIICTHGQLRAASWILLDLLVESGCQLYYSGDLDPEGILIAQRLKDRYQHQVTYWRMDLASYETIISDEDISNRLSKMDAITSSELNEVVDALKKRKMAGYQEGLINELVNDIRREY